MHEYLLDHVANLPLLALQHVVEVVDLFLQGGHLPLQVCAPAHQRKKNLFVQDREELAVKVIRCIRLFSQRSYLFSFSAPPSRSAFSCSSSASPAAILSLRRPLSTAMFASSLCSSSTCSPFSSDSRSAACSRSDCSARRERCSRDSACERNHKRGETVGTSKTSADD